MSEQLPVASGTSVFREAWRVVGRRGWRLIPLFVLLVGGALAGIVSPLALGSVIDVVSSRLGDNAGAGSASASGDPSILLGLGALMAVSVIVGAVLTGLGIVAASQLFETMLADLREKMVTRAFDLPQSRIESAGTGDLISRAGDDVAEVAEAIPSVVPALAGSLFTIVVTVIGMAVIDVWYAVALLILVPVHVFAVRQYLKRAPTLYAEERRAMAVRAQHMLDSLRGIESVQAYGLTANRLGAIARASWAVVRWSMSTLKVQNTFFARLNFAEFLGMAGLLIVGFVLVGNGIGTVGGATAAMLLFLRLFGPINQLLFVIDSLQSALASLARIVGVITARVRPETHDTDAGVTDSAGAALRFENVTHEYIAGHPVLRDLDLVIHTGETVAVVGASGAGKSTLAALAAGVHVASSGTILAPDDVVLVTQEVHVFNGTLRDNLTLANIDASDERVLEVLREVGASGLVDRLPDGLDTALGDAHLLTSADAQLVALARVVLAGPDLVILDEATAEAGSSEAGLLERAAAAVTRGRTALVIAHRLNQASVADRVIVMEHGRITEQGTHARLLEAGGAYATLWEAWSRGR